MEWWKLGWTRTARITKRAMMRTQHSMLLDSLSFMIREQAGYESLSLCFATLYVMYVQGVPLSNFKLWPFASCNTTFETCQCSLESRKTLRKVLSDGMFELLYKENIYLFLMVRFSRWFWFPWIFFDELGRYLATYRRYLWLKHQQSTGVRVELTSTRRAAIHRYTFPPNSTEPRIVVDITNEGQQSSTNPFATVDPSTGRVVGSSRTQSLRVVNSYQSTLGGAEFAASFGPGRYSVFACFDFKGDGYNFTGPTEYGTWLSDFPIRFATNLNQLYFGVYYI